MFPDDEGLNLLPYTGKDCLTYEGEINKMAVNVAFGRYSKHGQSMHGHCFEEGILCGCIPTTWSRLASPDAATHSLLRGSCVDITVVLARDLLYYDFQANVRRSLEDRRPGRVDPRGDGRCADFAAGEVTQSIITKRCFSNPCGRHSPFGPCFHFFPGNMKPPQTDFQLRRADYSNDYIPITGRKQK